MSDALEPQFLPNRQQRRDGVRSLTRPVRRAYGFGRWRQLLAFSYGLRTDGRR